jgi:hypothetical protein
VVRDAITNEEIDISEIDTAFFVLTVDLWSADGKKEAYSSIFYSIVFSS